MKNHHLKKRISSGQELSHDDLEDWLALKLFLFGGELDVQLTNKSVDLIFLGVLDRVEDLEDRIKNELIEGAFQLLAFMVAGLCPLLGLWVEIVVALGSYVSKEKPTGEKGYIPKDAPSS